MLTSRFNYQISLQLPQKEINYTLKNFLQLLHIKIPIKKMASFYDAILIIDANTYKKIIDNFDPVKLLDGYLSIYTTEQIIKCNLEDSLKEQKQYNLIENQPIKILRIVELDKIQTSKDRLGFKIVNILFASSKAIEMHKDFSLCKKYENMNMQDMMNIFKSRISNYQVRIHEKAIYNTHKYDQIVIKNDIDLLTVPYYLHKNYRLTNGIPVMFYDTFASPTFFNSIDTYKIIDYTTYESFIKKDLSEYKYVTEIIKTEKLNNDKIVKYLSDLPNKLLCVLSDTSITEITIKHDKNIDNSYFDKDKMKYTNTYTKTANSQNIIIHTPDNPNNAQQRYKNVSNLFNKIDQIVRYKIYDTTPQIFDIGILYRTNKQSKYNITFLNMCYQFIRNSSGSINCNVIGDAIVFK